eukprot:1593219-Amphidinium_carterae.2
MLHGLLPARPCLRSDRHGGKRHPLCHSIGHHHLLILGPGFALLLWHLLPGRDSLMHHISLMHQACCQRKLLTPPARHPPHPNHRPGAHIAIHMTASHWRHGRCFMKSCVEVPPTNLLVPIAAAAQP